jgi:hypothetical protein
VERVDASPRDVVDSLALIFYSTVHSARDVAKAQVSDFWDVREGGRNEEDLDQLLKGRSDRCVCHYLIMMWTKK